MKKETWGPVQGPAEESRYYITDILPFKGILKTSGEKMEPDVLLRNKGRGSLGERILLAQAKGKQEEGFLIKVVEEKYSYMADMVFEDKPAYGKECGLQSVHYDPVLISKNEKICIVRKDSGSGEDASEAL